jgi:transposase
MEKTDTRKLPSSVQYELRKQVVRLKQAGRSGREISEITGLSQEHISRVWRSFQKDGESAIKIKTRGRRLGAERVLNPEQEKTLRNMMIDKTPDQLKFPFALWTRRAVQVVAEKHFKVLLTLRTVSNYMKRWGFTPQKPMKLAYEQKPEAVKAWLNQSYPEIVRRAKEENAEINWGDETGVEANDYTDKGYAPKGRTPVLRLTGSSKRTRINMISAITNQGQVRFMMYKEKMSPSLFIKFMARLVKQSTKKVFLIVDNLRTHHSRKAAKWLAIPETKTRIELFFLPPYSPELNPDERLNSDLKGQIRSGLVARTQDDVKRKIRSSMKIIQNRPERVKKYFQDQRVAYAA